MSEAAAVEQFELGGPRVRLRIPREQDARRLFELASDAEVTRFFSWGPYQAEAEALAWLQTLPARRAEGVALELAGGLLLHAL